MKTHDKSFIWALFICLTTIFSEGSAIGSQSDPGIRILEGAKEEGALV